MSDRNFGAILPISRNLTFLRRAASDTKGSKCEFAALVWKVCYRVEAVKTTVTARLV
jgi:hypothetical protein